jgi:hypothetical protein
MVKPLTQLIVICILVCSSCGYYIVPEHIKQNFTYCYDGMDTGIDTLINIEGYFVQDHIIRIFYKDGIYVIGGFRTIDDFNEFIKKIESNRKAMSNFHKWYTWGRYIICGDTIKLQAVERPVFGSTSSIWYSVKGKYKVLDRNTIIGIYPSSKERIPPTKFVPLTIKPDSNCWLKEKKWFWCNEEDWKAYKKSMK